MSLACLNVPCVLAGRQVLMSADNGQGQPDGSNEAGAQVMPGPYWANLQGLRLCASLQMTCQPLCWPPCESPFRDWACRRASAVMNIWQLGSFCVHKLLLLMAAPECRALTQCLAHSCVTYMGQISVGESGSSVAPHHSQPCMHSISSKVRNGNRMFVTEKVGGTRRS